MAEGTPETHVSTDDPSVILVHGIPDENVPITQRQQSYEAPTPAGVGATLIEVEGLGHSIGDTIKTGQVRHDLIDVFDAHLKDGKA